MSMSRKDFELIAETIKLHDFDGVRRNVVVDRARLACHFADTLETTNERFDRQRFIAACRPSWLVGSSREGAWDRTVEGWE